MSELEKSGCSLWEEGMVVAAEAEELALGLVVDDELADAAGVWEEVEADVL